MKIVKSELMRIVREELEGVLKDLKEVNPWHHGSHPTKGGQFSSKKDAKVYSLSDRAKRLLGPDSELEAPLRGKVTGGGKVNALAGMNTSRDKACGRQRMTSGDPKSPTHSCSEYPERYDEAFQALEEIAEELAGRLHEGPECDACLQNFIARLKQANLKIKDALDPKVQQEHETYGGEKVSPVTRTTPSRRSSERRKKFKTMAGMNFAKSGFSKAERSLLNPNSLFEGQS